MLPNLHKQVSGGKLRYLRTQVSDRPWAKEPAPLGFWGGEGSPGGGWGGGVGFAFVARAGKGRCPSRAPGVPPAPRCPSCAPVSLLRPRCPRVSGAPTAPRLHSRSHPTRGPRLRDPPRRACPREAQSRVGGLARRAPTWRGRRAGKRSAGPGSSREPRRPRLHGTREGWSGAQGGRARRVRLRGLRTPGLPERGARGADRCGRGEVAIDPVLATDPFIRAAGGRSSEPGRRTSEESAPRAGGQGTRGSHQAGLGSGLPASGPAGSRPDATGAALPLPLPSSWKQGVIPRGHFQCLLPTTLVGSRDWGDGEGLRKLFSGAAAGGAAERRGRGVLFPQAFAGMVS